MVLVEGVEGPPSSVNSTLLWLPLLLLTELPVEALRPVMAYSQQQPGQFISRHERTVALVPAGTCCMERGILPRWAGRATAQSRQDGFRRVSAHVFVSSVTTSLPLLSQELGQQERNVQTLLCVQSGVTVGLLVGERRGSRESKYGQLECRGHARAFG